MLPTALSGQATSFFRILLLTLCFTLYAGAAFVGNKIAINFYWQLWTLVAFLVLIFCFFCWSWQRFHWRNVGSVLSAIQFCCHSVNSWITLPLTLTFCLQRHSPLLLGRFSSFLIRRPPTILIYLCNTIPEENRFGNDLRLLEVRAYNKTEINK